MQGTDEPSETILGFGVKSERIPGFPQTDSGADRSDLLESDLGLALHEPLVNIEEQIDISCDPLAPTSKTRPTAEWEEEMKMIRPRELETPSELEQVERIRTLLNRIESETGEPDERELSALIQEVENLSGVIPNHETFVAGSFQRYYHSWKQLIGNSNRKSAKSILSWIRKGYRPRFEGTQNAKTEKLKIVRTMLSKVVGENRLDEYLAGNRPKRIEFLNHRSFYDRWEFLESEIRKNLKSGAVGIWPLEGEPPEVISPMGVVESAGKERLICNDRYVNAFLKLIPFEYEKLRDLLSFTQQGSYMATADLKSGYFHVPIHPAHWKYFRLKWARLSSSIKCCASDSHRPASCSPKSCKSQSSKSALEVSRCPVT